MKNVKTILNLLLISGFSLAASGCTNSGQVSSSNEQIKLPEVGEKLSVVDGVGFDYKKAFFDDFTNGVDYDTWIISEDCWGSNKGGLTVKNLFFTDEGTLIFRANGNYYSGDEVRGYGSLKDGKCTGASLVSKFLTGPGRYQVKMKPMPRLGACTAFWTYSNRPVANAENDNHEIDIELPGGMSGNHSFKSMMNTNYITEKYQDHSDFVLSEVTNNQVINLNDGEWHTFGFDWYTNPEVIVYYVDDVVTCVSTTFIPYLLTRIWVAVWMSISDSFMGPANFETDFMELDWIEYIPFDRSQPYTECDVDAVSISAPKEDYPTLPSSRPEINKVANGDFEYIVRKNKQEDYGWKYEMALSDEEVDISEICYADKTGGKDGTAGGIVNKNGYLHTTIDSAYEGYKYDLEFDAKSTGEDSVMRLSYFKSAFPDNNSFQKDYVQIKKGDWSHYKTTITCPKDCACFEIEYFNNSIGSTSNLAIDNVSLRKAA